MPSSIFDELPVELMQAIACRLATQDLHSFRLSCKRIYENTRYTFRCHFFQTLQINLSLASLERLMLISMDSKIAPHVQTLVVKYVDEPNDKLGQGVLWKRHSSGYLLPEAGVHQWTEVLRRLVNCTSFHLIRQGWSDKETCLNHFTSTDIITVILNGIIDAHIPVREFLVDFIPPTLGGVNEIDLRRVNGSDLWKPEFITAWANLRTLLLNFTMTQSNIMDWIDPIVRHASGLRKLIIKFDHGLAAHAVIEHLSSLETPWQLQELTLKAISRPKPSEETLSKLLCNYRQSLRVLDLHMVDLDGPSWKSIFRSLSEFPLLESFSLRCLREGHGLVHFPVASESPEFTFRARKLRSRTINIDVSYRGPSMKDTIQKLIESMEVHYPKRLWQSSNNA